MSPEVARWRAAGRRRDAVAISGMGVVCSVGIGVPTFWSALRNGICGIGPVRSLDLRGLRANRGAEVLDLDYGAWARARSATLDVGRSTQLALVAATEAVESAKLEPGGYAPERIGVIVGSTVTEPRDAEAIGPDWAPGGADRLPPSTFLHLIPGMMPAALAAQFGFLGPVSMVLTSCASGNQALVLAMDLMRTERCDAVLVGGADALSLMTFVGFSRMRALAEVCQPFDRNRRGLVLGEGSAFLVLEWADSCRRRGAAPLCELAGGGLGFDAHHMTSPHPEGRGGERAIRAALADARATVEDIDYVSAHGTGTVSNDRLETALMKKVFGSRAYGVPISSIKSMIGHTMGAASVFEAVATVMAIRDGIVPPTIHYSEPDPECDLDYVPNRARCMKVRTALSPAFGFGGNCAAVVLRAFPEDAVDEKPACG